MGGDAAMAEGDDDSDEEERGAGKVGQQGAEEEKDQKSEDDAPSWCRWRSLARTDHDRASLQALHLAALTPARANEGETGKGEEVAARSFCSPAGYCCKAGSIQ